MSEKRIFSIEIHLIINYISEAVSRIKEKFGITRTRSLRGPAWELFSLTVEVSGEYEHYAEQHKKK